MMKTIAILTGIILLSVTSGVACNGCGDTTTFEVTIRGFSDGIYEFRSSFEGSRNLDWSRETAFSPASMMSKTTWEAEDCFAIFQKDELWFNKVPGVPSDPYFMMDLAVSGKNGDDFIATMNTLYDIDTGAMMSSTGSGDFAKIEYSQFADNFDGWTALYNLEGTNTDTVFSGMHGFDQMTRDLISKFSVEH